METKDPLEGSPFRQPCVFNLEITGTVNRANAIAVEAVTMDYLDRLNRLGALSMRSRQPFTMKDLDTPAPNIAGPDEAERHAEILAQHTKVAWCYDFTRRELAVASRLALGHSSPQIAAELYLSNHTVRTHAQRVRAKLGLVGTTDEACSRVAVANVMNGIMAAPKPPVRDAPQR